jgi:hypothetical protein
MKELILIKSPQNNKGSQGYANKINSLATFHEVIVIEMEISDQETLNNVLNTTCEKCLILDPSKLVFPEKHKHRNAEGGQVIDVILSFLEPCKKPETTILLMGYDSIGESLFHRLRSLRYNVMPISDNAKLTAEFVNHFDFIINCTSGEDVGYYYGGVVLDINGNWKTKDRISNDLTSEIPVKVIRRPSPKIITSGEIRTITAELMLGGF